MKVDIFQFSHSLSVWKFYIFPIFLFSLLYNIPKFLELSVTKLNCSTNSSTPMNETECFQSPDDDPSYDTQLKIEATSPRLYPFYVKYYLIYLNFIIHGIIPLVSLVILNTLIYRQVCFDLIYI